jgi:hypothetical protein
MQSFIAAWDRVVSGRLEKSTFFSESSCPAERRQININMQKAIRHKGEPGIFTFIRKELTEV